MAYMIRDVKFAIGLLIRSLIMTALIIFGGYGLFLVIQEIIRIWPT